MRTAQLPEDERQRQRRRRGRHQRTGKMDERAGRAIIIRSFRSLVARRRQRAGCCLDPDRGMSAEAVEMHMAEREHELDGKRKERNTRAQSQTRTKPMHGCYILHTQQ